jgi:hypothetical protein
LAASPRPSPGPLLLAGVPTVDIVRMLGLAVIPNGPAWAWWTAGMALHVVVGVIWAVFYAYFFWSVFALRPLWQGLLFTLVPMVLATAVVYPQLGVMQAATPVVHVDPWQLLAGVSWGERRGLLLGHGFARRAQAPIGCSFAIYSAALSAMIGEDPGSSTGGRFASTWPPKPKRMADSICSAKVCCWRDRKRM